MSAEVAGGVSLILIGLQVAGLLGYWFSTSGLTLGVAIPPASARLQLSKHQKIQKVKDMFKAVCMCVVREDFTRKMTLGPDLKLPGEGAV